MPIPTTPPREDDICDVIAKAMRGHGLSPEELAARTQLPVHAILQALSDTDLPLSKERITAIAKELDLSAHALANLPSYHPIASPPKELAQIVTPFGYAGANAYILKHGTSATIFDTGTDPAPLLDYLKHEQLGLDALYITHGHHDHISGVPAFPNTPCYFPDQLSQGETRTLAEGIQITALEADGHFTPSKAYLIEGLTVPLCICGDIIFAGSMGKTPDSSRYQQSLGNARNHLMTLPPETILCSGHGPLTTVEQESKNNPFLA